MLMRALAVIPARLGSTRLPNKVLADIGGKPLVWHVWNRVLQARRFHDVSIATDSDAVREVMEAFGARVLMTSPDCRSGTERIATVLDQLGDADLIVNVQGDEPLISPAMLDGLVDGWAAHRTDLVTPVFRITDAAELHSPTIVKVVRSAQGEALYFSRQPIPFVRDHALEAWLQHAAYWGHLGVYGYRPAALAAYLSLPVSPLETAESLEQLRFLEAGYRFLTVETTYRSIAVDVAADLDRVRSLIAKTL